MTTRTYPLTDVDIALLKFIMERTGAPNEASVIASLLYRRYQALLARDRMAPPARPAAATPSVQPTVPAAGPARIKSPVRSRTMPFER